MTLTHRFDTALQMAHDLHRAQVRKGNQVPYISHLLAVAGIVLEAGADEDEAIAALLHDGLQRLRVDLRTIRLFLLFEIHQNLLARLY